jgi:hypothetical protein
MIFEQAMQHLGAQMWMGVKDIPSDVWDGMSKDDRKAHMKNKKKEKRAAKKTEPKGKGHAKPSSHHTGDKKPAGKPHEGHVGKTKKPKREYTPAEEAAYQKRHETARLLLETEKSLRAKHNVVDEKTKQKILNQLLSEGTAEIGAFENALKKENSDMKQMLQHCKNNSEVLDAHKEAYLHLKQLVRQLMGKANEANRHAVDSLLEEHSRSQQGLYEVESSTMVPHAARQRQHTIIPPSFESNAWGSSAYHGYSTDRQYSYPEMSSGYPAATYCGCAQPLIQARPAMQPRARSQGRPAVQPRARSQGRPVVQPRAHRQARVMVHGADDDGDFIAVDARLAPMPMQTSVRCALPGQRKKKHGSA